MPNSTAPLARYHFDTEGQLRFGELSGDINPLHMDELAARRLVAGRAVVHGIHTLLRVLEQLPGLQHWPNGQVECEFLNPVSVGDEVEIRSDAGTDQAAVYLACVDGIPCARVTIGAVEKPMAGHADSTDLQVTPRLMAPLDLKPESWVGERLRLALPAASCHTEFPRACGHLGERRVAALALLSYFVGMVCPGQNSVFASLTAQAGENSDFIAFQVRSFHPRFRQFVIQFEGCIRGEIRAFERPSVQLQPTTADLLASIDAQQFEGRRAWVIGGSRGLGELAAKILGAGGAEVLLTYATGRADAVKVAEDINEAARGRATPRELDIARDDLAKWVLGTSPPDAVFYFATPRIFRKKAPQLQPALLGEFLDFYVYRLEALCRAVHQHNREHPFVLFHPSSVAIDERPRGMTEYAMAKAAAEVLVAELPRWLRNVRVVNRRLPRLDTDQTATFFAKSRTSNLDVMLPLVRDVMKHPGA